MDKVKMQSLDVTGSNIDKIARLFPQCVTERKGKNGKTVLGIDFEKLREELSADVIDDGEERYQFTWPDKKAHAHLANTPTNKTLRPCREESVDFDNTQNLYIEGDNLDVLKVLRETYLGKVKMIYIDPPYNTGNDFVYNDDFSQNADDYQDNSGQFDEEGNRLVQNTESNGRFHTDWLNMIYPRLKVAKDLLSDDGAIFISIDDNELHNLIKCCDEIFGETNKIGLMTIMSNPRGSQNSKYLSYIHEYILMYAKNANSLRLKGVAKSEDSLKEYSETEENGRRYRLLGLRKRGGAWRKEDRPNMFYPVFVNPQNGQCNLYQTNEYSVEVMPQRPSGELGRWTWGKDKFQTEQKTVIAKKVNRDGKTESWDIFRKDYIDSEDGEEKTTKIKSIWIEKETNYQNAKNEIKSLFGNSEVFDYPKPTYIVQRLASMMNFDENDIIMDFFSGSATTAHATIQMNINDKTNVSYILIQLPEKVNIKSQARKLGYKNICEIGKERIRRAGKKIKEENANKEGIDKLDIGFRVLKLDSSNMQDVYYTPKEFTERDLFADNVKPDRTAEDLLFQVMLDLGVELSATIEQRTIDGKQVFFVNDNYLVACFDENISENIITEIAKMKPYYFVMRDSSLASDNVADNFDQLFETYSKDTIRKII
ncbi:site-specific DNA-methyltransferase [Bacteroides sp. AN502]|nr:site-specific DNA-methyltransferase [Caecibacteroides pullorum]MDC6281707.1 site-specific DNA-methyltransferase [Caecibacteroides pullorum]